MTESKLPGFCLFMLNSTIRLRLHRNGPEMHGLNQGNRRFPDCLNLQPDWTKFGVQFKSFPFFHPGVYDLYGLWNNGMDGALLWSWYEA
jgi:hypothetical protein